MRTIKFRTWDTIAKVMDYEGGQLEPTWILHNKIYEPYSDAHILMQFTGLLDKNGKEIYESDIVETEYGAKGICYWDDEKSAFLFDCKEPGWSHPIYGMSGEKQVIGNIYEKPSLTPAPPAGEE